MAQQARHTARLAAFALGIVTVLHFGLQIFAGLTQCHAWETCPW